MSLYAEGKKHYDRTRKLIFSQNCFGFFIIIWRYGLFKEGYPMSRMLTAKEIQTLLQVDRSTIYRMAEAGKLPAVKVGKQWRFPEEQVQPWLRKQFRSEEIQVASISDEFVGGIECALTQESTKMILDVFAESMGVMLALADLNGEPILDVSNSLPLYQLLAATEDGHALCHEKWRELGRMPALEPRFMPGIGGLLCSRAFVRMGMELKTMVIVFGVAPPGWSPDQEEVRGLAKTLNVP
jgi:excisionase family DNA binding protein